MTGSCEWREEKLSTSTDDEKTTEKRPSFSKKTGFFKYKTEMCKNFSEMGYCPYYQKCQFAHGLAELHQNKQAFNEFYRTRACRPFKERGTCSYGSRCQFSHKLRRESNERIGLILMRQIFGNPGKEEGRLLALLTEN